MRKLGKSFDWQGLGVTFETMLMVELNEGIHCASSSPILQERYQSIFQIQSNSSNDPIPLSPKFPNKTGNKLLTPKKGWKPSSNWWIATFVDDIMVLEEHQNSIMAKTIVKIAHCTLNHYIRLYMWWNRYTMTFCHLKNPFFNPVSILNMHS